MRPGSLALALVAIAFLGGCGAGHNTTLTRGGRRSPAGPPVFADNLDALCRHESRELAGRVTQGKTLKIYRLYLREFEAITPPPSERADYSKFLDNYRRAISALRAARFGAANAAIGDNRVLVVHLGAPSCGPPTPGGY